MGERQHIFSTSAWATVFLSHPQIRVVVGGVAVVSSENLSSAASLTSLSTISRSFVVHIRLLLKTIGSKIIVIATRLRVQRSDSEIIQLLLLLLLRRLGIPEVAEKADSLLLRGCGGGVVGESRCGFGFAVVSGRYQSRFVKSVQTQISARNSR